jgi:hypothetical protein
VCVSDGEGIFEDGLDGTPDVDDLMAGKEEGVGFGGGGGRGCASGRRCRINRCGRG